MSSLQPADVHRARLEQIERARQSVLHGAAPSSPGIEPWIERSWRRCLAAGLSPRQPVGFETISQAALRRTLEESHALIDAARPVLHSLRHAMTQTRYFAVLTNAKGVVVSAHGPIDTADRRAAVITRVGADLSEDAVGTTAISAALIEQQPVWLHRGEHFFDDTSAYSCAGAPLFGPHGQLLGMLDLTGIDAAERPELRHLVSHAARSIENALTLRQPHALLLRINWLGQTLGGEDDGLVCLDADGFVTGANRTARILLPALTFAQSVHADDLFALPLAELFDAARRGDVPRDLPLWSGLRLQAWVHLASREPGSCERARSGETLPLKDLELHLIRKAVADAHGNVQQAAHALGISRATVYRKLGRRAGHTE
ncbi:MAG: hypothetical protein Fur0019_06370 [Tibeticola sp.]